MADLSSNAAPSANNPYPHSIPYDVPPLAGGLVQHALVSASTQVQILSIVDVTGSATVGDIVAELPDHPDPVGAIVVMINLRVLCAELRGGVMDANTIVRRCPDPQDKDNPRSRNSSVDPYPPSTTDPTGPGNACPAGLQHLEITGFSANVVIGPGDQRRDFIRLDELHRPGVYGLMSGASIYVGMSGDVAQRIATGQQPIETIEAILAIIDASGNLTIDDARCCERILWSRCAALGDRRLVNGVPDGAPIDADRYSQLDLFVTQACLALRQHGVLFTRGSVRGLMAGPRSEPGRLGPLRLPNDAPTGELYELCFCDGMVALAAREADDRWLLLRGSDVRSATVATAGAGPSFLRAAWAHAGLLERSADDSGYVVTRDLVFGSGSAAALFVTGAKGRGLAGWQKIEPDGGGMPALAAC